jgi:ureidoglycolate lyase
MPSLHLLHPEVATPERFAPFGALIGAAPGAARATTFYNDSVQLWDIPGLVTDSDACISVARIHPRTPAVRWMERHFRHTQAFLPLNDEPFAMVLAPPNAANVPDPDSVRAFWFPRGQGVLLGIGTWHEFPFALAGSVDIAVFLRNETNQNLDVVENGEAVGGDLEKRDIQARLGLTFTIAT